MLAPASWDLTTCGKLEIILVHAREKNMVFILLP
jgi:hypothetical protein